MTTNEKGNLGEVRVLSEFVKLGIQCYLPYGDGSGVDLIADFGDKLNRIQVKTTEKLNRAGAMEWKITRQEGYHGNRVSYVLGEIDYFAFYCIETDIVCLVPFDKDFPTTTLSIRLDDYAGTRLSTMRFASDYSVANIVASS
jgi:hypothetical protein